jgi:hypothetical protein
LIEAITHLDSSEHGVRGCGQQDKVNGLAMVRHGMNFQPALATA